MSPQEITEILLERYEMPEFEPFLQELQAQMTVELIAYLKKRVDEEKLKDAHLALRIASLAQSLVPYINQPEAEALADWAKGSALLHLSRYQEALHRYQSAAAIYVTLGEKLAWVGIQASMVEVLRTLGQHQAALALANEARSICLALGSPARRYLANLEMNVGIVYEQLGNPEMALQVYLRAREFFVQLGDSIQAARIDINRSIIHREMSRFVMAQELLLSARQVLLSQGHLQQVARVDANLGILAHSRGRYQEALTYFEAARQGFADMGALIAQVDLRRGLIYRKLNLIQEMIELAVAVEPIFAQNGMFTEQARALYQQGVGYQLGGHYVLAESYLMKARTLLQQLKKGAIVLELDYDLACLARDSGRLDDARQLALRLTLEVAPDTWPRLAAQALLLLAECTLQQEPDHAREYVQAALQLSIQYALHESRIKAHHLLGKILEHTGSRADAWVHYQTAIEQIESLRRLLLIDQFRLAFMEDKLPIYADAIRLSQTHGTAAQLLYTLNLAYSAPLFQLPPEQAIPLNHELESELALLREKWHWYQNQLEEAREAMSIKELRSQLGQVESDLAHLMHRWQLYNTSMGQAQRGLPFSATEQFLAEMQQSLRANEFLLHYYIINNAFQAFFMSKEQIHIFPDLTSTNSLGRILRGWNRLLTHIQFISQSAEASQSLAQRYLTHFQQALVKPLASHLTPQSHLFVIMPPGWHELPLPAFFDGQHYFIEQHQITYLSAPEALKHNIPRRQPAPSPVSAAPQALIVALSDGAGVNRHHGGLTGTLQAAQRVAEGLPSRWQSTLLIDEEATFERFQANCINSALIHLATHATFRPDNPLFSWAQLANHRLTVADIYQMKLPQRALVILSACETGRGQARGGGLLGMGRALLAAGASGVMVTLWRVEDQATAQLMSDFYNLLAQEEDIEKAWAHKASASLRQAQLQAIAKELHPFFWAAFIFIQG